MLHILERLIPAIAWMRSYRKENLGWDLTAGATTAVLIIPQGIAYAMLAGLPPITGLYASIVPLIVYAFFGTSRQLAIGPTAMDSLLVFASLITLAKVNTEEYIFYAASLAFIAGLIQVTMGIFRLGFLVKFLSKPLISGFTAAAAFIIGFSQLKDLLGVKIERTHLIHRVIGGAIDNIASASLLTFVIGMSGIAVLVFLKRKYPKIPRALFVVVLGIALTYFFKLADQGLAVIGTVPSTFPTLVIPELNLEVLQNLLPSAAILALIGFMEAISIAKGFEGSEDVDANKELIALGLSNVGSGLVQGYNVTGSFSRSAVNNSAGARTPLAGIVTAALVALALLYLTPLFFFLPRAIIAAIIVASVFGFIDIPALKGFWANGKSDFLLYVLTFFATLSFGIVWGLGIGLAISLLLILGRKILPKKA